MPHPNFLNENRGRTFPFLGHFQELLEVSESTSISIPTVFTMSQLPNSAVVDFGCTMGVLSFFEEGQHTVYLFEVRRQQSNIIFEFRSDAPGLADRALLFSRDVTSDDYETEYADSLFIGVEFSLSESTCVADQIWEGYMASGTMREVIELLTMNGMKIRGDVTEAIVEPALVRSLVDSYARSINLGNGDRTRATNPPECIQPVHPFTTQPLYIERECMIGPIRWKEGFNCAIDQDDTDNSITINGAVGGGLGEPCDEVEIFPGEQPPAGSTLLTGGATCNEVIRSINGVGGRVVDVLSGRGVTVTSDLTNNAVVIDIDTNDLAVCFQGEDPEESFCPEESENSLCGPV